MDAIFACGSRAFLSMPLNEFKGELLSLTDTPLNGYDDLYHKLADVMSYSDKVLLIEDWLSQVIAPEQSALDIVNASLNLLNQHQGAVAISAIAETLDINPRRLERLFNDQVGLTAKEYARNIRIKQARVYLKQQPNLSLANVAYDLGFFDQSHFSKQFKQVVGISPKAYASKSQTAT
ncbi:MAG: AraC family transcriptional regulator [Proteobacteria bacterium]|nr:AraC family transcriptional regulator [Pseudomonadota bacterium]